MSVSRPARCLFSQSIPKLRPRIRSQRFHCSPSALERERRSPRGAPAKAFTEEEVEETRKRAYALFKAYSDSEKTALAKKYTPEQIEAIEAGEAAIDPLDLEKRAVVRTDIGALSYLDDLSSTKSVIDREQQYDGPLPPHMRPMTEDEFWKSYNVKQEELRLKAPPPPATENPDDPEYVKKVFPTRIDDERIAKEMDLFMGQDGPVPRYMTPSFLAPALPISFMSDDTNKTKEDTVDPRDPDGVYNRLIKQTGLDLNTIMKYRLRVLVMNRVSNQTRLGKIASTYCLAIAGNGDGILGIGEAKGQELIDTQNNAKIAAIRNMRPVPRYEFRTIYGDVEAKVSASQVKIMSRPPGFGLRCQHHIFEMARAAGIQDLAARVPRSRNKMNTVKAAYQAFMSQRVPNEVARGLGKKLVDVRKVYYAGQL